MDPAAELAIMKLTAVVQAMLEAKTGATLTEFAHVLARIGAAPAADTVPPEAARDVERLFANIAEAMISLLSGSNFMAQENDYGGMAKVSGDYGL